MKKKNSHTFTFPQVCIVEASAGSGKTYCLARRYVQLLINPYLKLPEIPLRNILAITFTNKAAVEMKERILELLKKIAFDQFSSREEEEDVLSSLLVERQEARKKAHLVMDYLIKNYNFFQVQTIDSFINSLLSGCSFRLDLSSSFKIKDDYHDYLEYSLDKLIDRADSDKDIFGLFGEFLTQYLYLENRTSWFPRREILALMGLLFSDSNIYGGKFKKYPGRSRDLIVRKRAILKLMGKLKTEAPEGTDKRFLGSFTSFLDENQDGFAIEDLSGFFERELFPVNKNHSVPEKTGKLWKNIRRSLSQLCELESALLFNCYLDIFNAVLTDLKNLSSKNDVLFLEELNRQARLLFDEESITVEELYYRLATRFRHYLIDEFQDTSILQWKNLFLMIEEALSTSGSLFYVGDKKQAIYRFRGGEVFLFDSVRERFRAFNVREELLSKNYRSQKEIVEFNNELFSRRNLMRFIDAQKEKKKGDVRFSPSDVEDILETFHDSRQSFREENKYGYVEVEPVDSGEGEETEGLIKIEVTALIKDLKKRFAYKDMAILSRDNLGVELVTSWLLEEGIAVESEKTLNIRENALIKELISFLRFLSSPIDNLSFASFILGNIFSRASGVGKETIEDFIFQLRKKETGENAPYPPSPGCVDKEGMLRRTGPPSPRITDMPVGECKNQPTKPRFGGCRLPKVKRMVPRATPAGLHFYKEFQRTFPKAWDCLIDRFFKGVGFVPLYELVISIMHEFRVMENFSEYQGFFMRLLELIKEKEEEYASTASFLEYFDRAREDDLYVSVTGADSVKVLTIHKSKGLEFEVVIVPFLKMAVKVGPGSRSYVVDSRGNDLRLLRLKKTYRKYSRILEEAYRQEYKESFIDELNNIYVALTRAKKEMYVFVPGKSGRSFNPANLLFPRGRVRRGRKRSYVEKSDQKESALMKIPHSEYRDWTEMLKEEFVEEAEIRNREQILRGEVLHFMLSLIGNLSRDDPEQVMAAALEKTRCKFPFFDEVPELPAVIRALLAREECRPIFFVEQGIVFPEKEIVGPDGNTIRIDRLVVKENEVWIIDYKSSREQRQEYRDQVRGYMRAVGDLYPASVIKGFLLYLDDLSLEEVEG